MLAKNGNYERVGGGGGRENERREACLPRLASDSSGCFLVSLFGYVVVEETEGRRGDERRSRERFWFTNELEERATVREWLAHDPAKAVA